MEPFTLVVVGAVVLFVLVGVGSFLAGGSLYDKIGEGGLSMAAPSGPPADSALARPSARWRSVRCCRRAAIGRCAKAGQALDIDAEMALLEHPAKASRTANTMRA